MDEMLALIAGRSKRGIPTNQLVYAIQDTEYLLEDEPDKNLKEYYQALLDGYIIEIERRRYINEHYVKSPDREIIQTIKEDTVLADIIEKYTEVFYSGKDRWKFRCPLHTDNHPSGIIYTDQQKWWCFQCNKGGDVFDAVQVFERIGLPEAIKKLATNLGLELRPLTKEKVKKTYRKKYKYV